MRLLTAKLVRAMLALVLISLVGAIGCEVRSYNRPARHGHVRERSHDVSQGKHRKHQSRGKHRKHRKHGKHRHH